MITIAFSAEKYETIELSFEIWNKEIKKNYFENVISNEFELLRQWMKIMVKPHKVGEVREFVPSKSRICKFY